MSTDGGTLPPVPAQYGTLEGTPPGTKAVPRTGRRRVRPMSRAVARRDPESGPPTSPEPVVQADPEVIDQGRADGGAVPDVRATRDTRAARGAMGPPTGNGVGYPEGYGAPVGYGAPPGYGPPGAPRYPVGPEGIGPLMPPPPAGRRSVRDRIEDRREARANELPDGLEDYQQRRFRRDKLRVVRGRRSRRIVRRIDTWTVLKVSLLFYICALIVVLISGIVLWNVSQAFNFTHDIEKSVKTLFGYNTFTLHPKPMFEYTALGGAVLAIVGTLVNLLVALVYNLIADVVGGIQIIVVTEDVN